MTCISSIQHRINARPDREVHADPTEWTNARIRIQKYFGEIRPTLMHTKNLYENGPNPFFFFGTKNMSEGHLMHTVLVCYVFDKLGQACL